MPISISCRELGMECFFVCEGETEADVVQSLVGHLHAEHDEDWFRIEEIYEAARAVIRGKAA